MTALHRLAACPGCGRQFDVSGSPHLAPLDPGETFACSCGAEVTVPGGRPEDAAVVSCSSCGGPRRGGEESCGWCGSAFTLRELDLDAICPRCMARVSRRQRFCHHCAVPLTATRVEGAAAEHDCPACTAAAGREGGDGERHPLRSRRVGRGDPLHLFECVRCGGLWLDRQVFTALVERARRGRAALPAPPVPRVQGAEREGGGDWSYRPCAVCGRLMNRVNYGRRSGVILDLCGDHGLWFDADELRRVLRWVERGGATEPEARAELEAERRRATAPSGGSVSPPLTSFGSPATAVGGGVVLEGVAWLVEAVVGWFENRR